jgi:hypothetical protein
MGILCFFAMNIGCHQEAATDGLMREENTPEPQIEADGKSTEPSPERAAGPAEEKTKNCAGDIRITEVMYDPSGTADTLGEYIELFNAGSDPVTLEGWTLSNGRRETHIFKSTQPLYGGEYRVLCASTDPDENGDLPACVHLENLSLANQGSLLHLKNPCGTSAIRFRYGVSAPWPTSRAGVAIELSHTLADVTNPKEWRHARSRMPSGDRGSPGVSPASEPDTAYRKGSKKP